MNKKNICAVCHKEIPSDANYCPHCGNDGFSPKNAKKRVSRFDKNIIAILFVVLVICCSYVFLKFGVPKTKPLEKSRYSEGNSASNYSSKECRFAENDNYMVFSDFENNKISVYDKATSESYYPDLFGTNLSIYKDTLYFIASKHATIGSYNLNNGVYEEISVENYFPNYKVISLDKLFVTDFGFTIACNIADTNGTFLSAFVQRDWLDMVKIGTTFYTSHLVLIASQILAYADNFADIPTVHLIDFETHGSDKIPLRTVVEYLYYGNDDNLYISLKDGGIIVAGPEDDGHALFLNDNINGSVYVYNNYLFYPSEEGLVRYNTKTKDSSLFIEYFFPNDIYFSSEGYMILSGTDTVTNKLVFAYSSVEDNTLQNIPNK